MPLKKTGESIIVAALLAAGRIDQRGKRHALKFTNVTWCVALFRDFSRGAVRDVRGQDRSSAMRASQARQILLGKRDMKPTAKRQLSTHS